MEKQRYTDIIFFSGRIATWQKNISGIKRHVYNYLEARGGNIITFVSAHLDADESNKTDVYEFAQELGIDPIKEAGVRFNLETFVPPKHPIYPTLREHRYGSMYYHNWRAMNMIKAYIDEHKDLNIRYIIKMRADVVLTKDFELPLDPREDCVYVPGSQYIGIPNDWFPDQVGAGTLKTMINYGNIYPNMIPEYDKRVNVYGYDLGVCERLMFNHLKDKGITWEFAPCEYDLNNTRLEFDKWEISFVLPSEHTP